MELTKIKSQVLETVHKALEKYGKRKLALAGVAALLVFAIALIAVFGGRGPEATVKKYVNASMEGNAKGIMKLIPEDVLLVALEEANMDEEEGLEFIEKKFTALYEQIYKYLGDDWDYSCKIVDTDELSKKSLREISELYEDDCDLEVKAACTVEIELTISYEGKEGSCSMEVPVVQIGRSWYLDVTRSIKMLESLKIQDLIDES